MRAMRDIVRWYRGADVWLAKTHPRLHVTGAHKLFPAALGVAALTAWTGHMTPGDIERISDTEGVTVGLFFLGLLLAILWTLRQWQRRASLPRGCKGGLVWSVPVNIACAASFFAPAATYSHASSSEVRARFPIAPVVDSLSEFCKPLSIQYESNGNGIFFNARNDRRPPLAFFTPDKRQRSGLMYGALSVSVSRVGCNSNDASVCLKMGFQFDVDSMFGCLDFDEFQCDSLLHGLPEIESISAADVFGKNRIDAICGEVKRRPPKNMVTSVHGELKVGDHAWLLHRGIFLRQLRLPVEGEEMAIRSLNYHNAPQNIQEIWRDGFGNINRLLRAHGTPLGAGMLRSFETILPVALLIIFISVIVTLAPYARWKILLLHALISTLAIVLLEAFAPMIGPDTQEQLHQALPFLVGAPPFLTLVLLFTRVRRQIYEVFLVTFWLSPFFLLLLWSRAWSADFWLLPRARLDDLFSNARGVFFSLVLIGVSILVSVSMLPILDRYRNLPET